MFRTRPWLRFIIEPEGGEQPSGQQPAPDPADDADGKQPDAGQQPAAPPKPEEQDTTDWKAKYEATVGESRKHEQRAKDNKTQLDAIRQALGLDDGKKVDPDKLAADLTASRTETVGLKVENAILRAATGAGANPDALTDSRSFMAAAAQLDPSSATFAKDVTAAITAAVKANPALAATPVIPDRSGGESKGGGAPADIDALIADAQKRGAFTEVIALKERKFAQRKQ